MGRLSTLLTAAELMGRLVVQDAGQNRRYVNPALTGYAKGNRNKNETWHTGRQPAGQKSDDLRPGLRQGIPPCHVRAGWRRYSHRGKSAALGLEARRAGWDLCTEFL